MVFSKKKSNYNVDVIMDLKWEKTESTNETSVNLV